MSHADYAIDADLQWAVGRAWLIAGYERFKPDQDIVEHAALAHLASTHAKAAMLCARTPR